MISIKILYISASIIPSKSANSVHVMKMCQALAENGNEVTLISSQGIDKEPFDFYNVKNKFKLIQTKSFRKFNKISFIPRLNSALSNTKNKDVIYTRWLLAASILILFGKKNIIFEYHGMASSHFNRILEKFIAESNCILKHIFITNILRKDFLNKYTNMHKATTVVLPDGADSLDIVKDITHSKKNLECGYIGSFQEGKGINIILKVAEKIPSMNFHVVGGSQQEIDYYKHQYNGNNIYWYGFLSQKSAMNILQNKIDIALLPNQPKVLIGREKKDIGKWTSPMKLFEYMSMRKAIVASNLDVIREILKDKENSILVDYQNVEEWVNAIELLVKDQHLYNKIASAARLDLERKYSWKIRARKVLEGVL